MKTVLTIAGSDSSGGAGIQADIKTITAHKLYAMSAITALTAQNTMGVKSILESTPKFLADQLDCIFQDIAPDAVKIGMVSSASLISVIEEKLRQYGAKKIVLDPVMVSTSGSRLLTEGAQNALIEKLLPLASVITPNLREAECLSGILIEKKEDMICAAEKIAADFCGVVLVKGGHLDRTADDLLYENGKIVWIEGQRVDNPNTHGTGCTLSSAIASNLAMGYTMEESIRKAKAYLTGALKDGMDLGHGSGPLNHCYWL